MKERVRIVIVCGVARSTALQQRGNAASLPNTGRWNANRRPPSVAIRSHTNSSSASRRPRLQRDDGLQHRSSSRSRDSTTSARRMLSKTKLVTTPNCPARGLGTPSRGPGVVAGSRAAPAARSHDREPADVVAVSPACAGKSVTASKCQAAMPTSGMSRGDHPPCWNNACRLDQPRPRPDRRLPAVWFTGLRSSRHVRATPLQVE